MSETHTQCLLRRGNAIQTAFIPSSFANAGNYVRLKDEDGWRVEAVFGTQPSEYVLLHERDHKNAFPSLIGKKSK